MSNEFWMVALPNSGDEPDVVLNKIKRATTKEGRNDFAEVERVDLPGLMVGTLDSLMALSDDLVKVDFQIESLVKRIDRQYRDLESAKSAGELEVAKQPVDRYIMHLVWDYARYNQRRTLPDLVAGLQGGVAKIEEELKGLGGAFSEKQQNVAALKRKKGGTLATANLEEILTEDVIRGHDLVSTEFLLTLIAVVPKNLEQEWLSTYESIGADIAGFNTPDWAGNPRQLGRPDGHFGKSQDRAKIKGSPVVPGSSEKLYEDGESALYTVTILKGQYEAGFYEGDSFQQGVFVDYVENFKNKARERRFIIRNFSFDPNAAQNAKKALETCTLELQAMHAQLIQWCKAHYGEAVTAWMHVKIIRLFVESVLRYGLPAKYTAVVFRPKGKKEKALGDALVSLFEQQTKQPEGAAAVVKDEDDKEDYSPYVLLKFNPTLASN